MDELTALEDESKNSLKSRREAAASRSQRWEDGDAVEARWDSKRGSRWYPGRITRVHELADDAPGGPGRAYDIAYDDGDREEKVLQRDVRNPTTDLR